MIRIASLPSQWPGPVFDYFSDMEGIRHGKKLGLIF
jgi:hypothetical protein